MPRVYPERLYHKTPAWVSDAAIFHVRIRCLSGNRSPLIRPDNGTSLLNSVRDYAVRGMWSCYLFLLMPDHVHALLGFGRSRGMSEVIRNWKRAQARCLGIQWQDNYFDHRIRDGAVFTEKYAYLTRNPVVLGLCASPEDWPWRTEAFAPEATPKF
ncbi:MAG: transposase [Verrucomicrobiota bacterium]